eukprot:6210388-Pleurochrysis_carterae.AAC.2
MSRRYACRPPTRRLGFTTSHLGANCSHSPSCARASGRECAALLPPSQHKAAVKQAVELLRSDAVRNGGGTSRDPRGHVENSSELALILPTGVSAAVVASLDAALRLKTTEAHAESSTRMKETSP